MLLKIGELAKRTGLTVRTLHHYDAIRLLCPSARSNAGYRLYNRADIERLHRIQALRRLDLSLADVASLLEGDNADLQTVIEQQIALLDRQAARTIELRDRLKLLLARLADNGQPDLPDWLATLELMTMYDKYFTSSDLATMRALTARLGKNVESEASALTARIRDLMDRNIAPESDAALALAKPWMARVNARMGGDVRLMMKLDAMHRNEPAVQVLTGVDGPMIDYMAKAFLEYRFSIYAKYLSAEEMQPMRANFGAHRPQWLQLTTDMREQMDVGADPLSPVSLELCARWLALSRKVWGADPVVHEKVRRAHASEPDLLTGTGVDLAMIAYLSQGISHLLAQEKVNNSGDAHASAAN